MVTIRDCLTGSANCVLNGLSRVAAAAVTATPYVYSIAKEKIKNCYGISLPVLENAYKDVATAAANPEHPEYLDPIVAGMTNKCRFVCSRAIQEPICQNMGCDETIQAASERVFGCKALVQGGDETVKTAFQNIYNASLNVLEFSGSFPMPKDASGCQRACEKSLYSVADDNFGKHHSVYVALYKTAMSPILPAVGITALLVDSVTDKLFVDKEIIKWGIGTAAACALGSAFGAVALSEVALTYAAYRTAYSAYQVASYCFKKR